MGHCGMNSAFNCPKCFAEAGVLAASDPRTPEKQISLFYLGYVNPKRELSMFRRVKGAKMYPVGPLDMSEAPPDELHIGDKMATHIFLVDFNLILFPRPQLIPVDCQSLYQHYCCDVL